MSASDVSFEPAVNHFLKLVREQAERVERISKPAEWLDYTQLQKLVIGVIGGDGIGPINAREPTRVLRELLKDETDAGKVEIREIEGLTIERRVKLMQPHPDHDLGEIRK